MTELKKKVSRRVTLLLDNRLTVRNRDKVTVTLYPDKSIGFRGYKSRHEIRLPLVVVYKIALIQETQEKRLSAHHNRRVRRMEVKP